MALLPLGLTEGTPDEGTTESTSCRESLGFREPGSSVWSGSPPTLTPSLPLQQPRTAPPTPGENRPLPLLASEFVEVWEAAECYVGSLKWGEVKKGFIETPLLSLVTSNLFLLSSTSNGVALGLTFHFIYNASLYNITLRKIPLQLPRHYSTSLNLWGSLFFNFVYFPLLYNNDLCFSVAALTTVTNSMGRNT